MFNGGDDEEKDLYISSREDKEELEVDLAEREISQLASENILKEVDYHSEICSICLLEKSENPTFIDGCYHCFCYDCISKWSIISRACPLCKHNYEALIHSVKRKERTDQDENSHSWDEHDFSSFKKLKLDPLVTASSRRNADAIPASTSSNNTSRSLDEIFSPDLIRKRRCRIYRNRLIATNFKKHLLEKDPYPNVKDFFQSPDYKTRIHPWISREIGIILNRDEDGSTPLLVLEFIISVLKNNIKNLYADGVLISLNTFLDGNAQTFLQELISFLLSKLSISHYDRYVRYEPVPLDFADRRKDFAHRLRQSRLEKLKSTMR